jgi:hypothetical protein
MRNNNMRKLLILIFVLIVISLIETRSTVIGKINLIEQDTIKVFFSNGKQVFVKGKTVMFLPTAPPPTIGYSILDESGYAICDENGNNIIIE